MKNYKADDRDWLDTTCLIPEEGKPVIDKKENKWLRKKKFKEKQRKKRRVYP